MQVRGKITDEKGEPLFGVTVLIARGKGVTTDFDGNYSFSDVNPNQPIRFSFVGRETKTFKAGEIPNVIKLAATSDTLDPVVLIANKDKGPAKDPLKEKRDYTIPIVIASVLTLATIGIIVAVRSNKNTPVVSTGLNQKSKNKLVTKKISLNGN